MIKYGLISQTDGETLERTIDLICNEFADTSFNICEIGIYNGETSRGLYQYITSKGRFIDVVERSHKWGGGSYFKCNFTAIDNQKDKPIEKPFPECNLIIGKQFRSLQPT